MPLRCNRARNEIAVLAGSDRPVPGELELHLAACSPCRAYLGGLRRIAGAMRALSRAAAPVELDGAVVAACHAGHREDRATREVRSLSRLPLPRALDARVGQALERLAEEAVHQRGRAPVELDGRVDAELDELRRALVLRLASRLSRRPAPPALTARLLATLRRAPERRGRRAALLAACSAGLLLALGLALGTRPAAVESAGQSLSRVERSERALEFVYAESPIQQLSPLARRIASGVTGGLLEAMPGGAQATSTSRRTPLGAPRAPRADDGERAGGSHEATGGGSGPAPSLLARVPLAPFDLRYAGERRVVLVDPSAGPDTRLVLRERVASDGAGHFLVDPLGVISAPPGSEAYRPFFLLMQKGRERFFFRHRDFRIRDLSRFQAQYVTRLIDSGVDVAGRSCAVLDVRRAEGAERSYVVWLDEASGLVMRHEERLVAGGELLAQVGFESFHLGPDAELGELSGGPGGGRELDLRPGAQGDLPFPAREPKYLPAGYQLQSASMQSDLQLQPWAEFVFGDGVEELFFLHSAPGGPADPGALPAGKVRASAVGPWTILEGEPSGTPVIAIGKLDVQEMMLFVHSAFD